MYKYDLVMFLEHRWLIMCLNAYCRVQFLRADLTRECFLIVINNIMRTINFLLAWNV